MTNSCVFSTFLLIYNYRRHTHTWRGKIQKSRADTLARDRTHLCVGAMRAKKSGGGQKNDFAYAENPQGRRERACPGGSALQVGRAHVYLPVFYKPVRSFAEKTPCNVFEHRGARRALFYNSRRQGETKFTKRVRAKQNTFFFSLCRPFGGAPFSLV